MPLIYEHLGGDGLTEDIEENDIYFSTRRVNHFQNTKIFTVNNSKERNTYFKKYPYSHEVKLSNSKLPARDISEVALSRQCCRHYSSDPVSLTELDQILYFSLGVNEFNKRMCPTGGGIAPIEAYVLALNIEGLKRGLYHYSPYKCSLEELVEPYSSDEFYQKQYSMNFKSEPSLIIMLTAVQRRTLFKYGAFGWQLIFLDAGHISQNILLASEALRLGACPVGSTSKAISNFLQINERQEVPVLSCAIGKKFEAANANQ